MMLMRNDNSDYNISSSSSFVVFKTLENSSSISLFPRDFFQAIPIEKKPNADTLKAMTEAKNLGTLENYNSIDDFFNDLEG